MIILPWREPGRICPYAVGMGGGGGLRYTHNNEAQLCWASERSEVRYLLRMTKGRSIITG